MSEKQVFLPPRTTGVVLHALILLLLLGGVGSLLFLTFARTSGGLLPLYILGVLVLLALLPVAAYRGYALLHARYEVERDGLRVRWGLRSEDIPLTAVMDVRIAKELRSPLRPPLFAFPGAILGAAEHEELGHLEFLASRQANFVIVSTVDETLVLSPEDPQDFVHRFDRLIEMGSLTPIEAHTALPAVYLRQMLNDRLSRLAHPAGAGTHRTAAGSRQRAGFTARRRILAAITASIHHFPVLHRARPGGWRVLLSKRRDQGHFLRVVGSLGINRRVIAGRRAVVLFLTGKLTS